MRCHKIGQKLASDLGTTDIKLCSSGSAYIVVTVGGFEPARGRSNRSKPPCKVIRVSDHAAHNKLSKGTWQVRTDVSSNVKKRIFSLGMICELKRLCS